MEMGLPGDGAEDADRGQAPGGGQARGCPNK